MEEEKIKKLKKLQLLEEEPSLAIFDELEDIQENLEPIKEALSGIEFIKGEKGEDGQDGINGQDGYTPIKGVDYFDGKNGVIGKDGKDGKDGINGNDGNDGVNGTDGLNGKNGKDGEKGEKGDKPNHKWNGTKLAFEKPNGEWGREVDLLGKPGKGGNGIFTYGGANLDNYLKLDITTAASTYVPYTGATTDVDLGNHSLTANNLWYLNGNTLGSKKTIGSIDNQDFGIITNNSERLTVLKGGNVGIGTTNPLTKLHIDGFGSIGGRDYSLLIRPSATSTATRFAFNGNNGGDASKAVLMGESTNGTGDFAIYTSSDADFSARTATWTNRFMVQNTGNVGIGTTAPKEQLEITKNFRLPTTVGTSAYGIIYKDGSSFIHDFNYGLNDNGITTTGGNTFVGIGAGNFAMGSTATSAGQASYNTGIGVSSLSSNTTGSYNTANGYYSLSSNTTGSSNTANGVYSLRSNTTGSNNTADGMYSLLSNTTGSNNTALGRDSLRSNTTGSYNTALGRNSGSYIADGTTGRSTGNNGLYLGYNSKASADGTNNEIVIGYNAVGKGSSTAIIGSESLKALYVSGQVIPATLTSNPTGIEGGIYFNTTDKHFYGYDGTTWKQLDN